jgi:hypothetical protein
MFQITSDLSLDKDIHLKFDLWFYLGYSHIKSEFFTLDVLLPLFLLGEDILNPNFIMWLCV